MKHSIVWHTPSPLWEAALKDTGTQRFRRPELLRFATDTFMEDLQKMLETNPAALQDYVAQPETWREEAVGWMSQSTSNGQATFNPDRSVKLFQPAHQRFYLAGANLVCRTTGLPDRTINPTDKETVTMVVRRLIAKGETVVPSDPTTFDEYGWFGPLGWKAIPDPQKVDTVDSTGAPLAEERLPMFPFTYCDKDNKRRLLVGLVPAANRETYQAAPREGAALEVADELANDDLSDLRLSIFQGNIAPSFTSLRDAILANQITLEAAHDLLVFGLLDLAEFLESYLPNVWNKILTGQGSLTGQEPDVYQVLQATLLPGISWANALKTVHQNKDKVNAGDTSGVLVLSNSQLVQVSNAINALGFKQGQDFYNKVKAVLDSTEPPNPEDVPGAPTVVDGDAGAIYVLRCVYERPRCALHSPPVVSAPSQPFQMASFFDPDAPIRPVRITMPMDTSIAGLRKSPKNVSVLFSSQLRNQLQKFEAVRKLTEVEEGNLGSEGGYDLGMICSFSLSIIFICAFVLLLIIMWVLNIVFWWSAFFKICFPIPVKKS